MGRPIDKAKLELAMVLEKYAPQAVKLQKDSPEHRELLAKA